MNLNKLKAWEIAKGLRNKDFSCEEITKKSIERIKEIDEDLNAFITVTEKEAIESARRVDEKFHNREEVSEIAGVPISIKDNISVKDTLMTCGSKMLENYKAPFDATVTKKIKESDGILLGKVNMDEFAMGNSTRTSYFGVTKNPIDYTRVSGGSSGGSAASVASGECCISIGTDTGGSVRQPASYCGVVGMKPTYGSISRFGVTSMANTFDQVGVISKDVRDAITILNVIEGRDKKDATSVGNPGLKYSFNYSNDFEEDLKNFKFAIPTFVLDMDLDATVKNEFEKALDVIKKRGAVIEAYDIKSFKYLVETYNILVNGEVSSNMSRFDSVRFGHRTNKEFENIKQMYKLSRGEGFGEEVKRRIMIGTHILSMDFAEEYYNKALKVRGLIKKDMDDLYKSFDFLICPTTPILPLKIDAQMTLTEIYQSDLFTIPANMVGLPSISLPMPSMEDGLSVGIELSAKRFKDKDLLKAALGIERSLEK